MHVELCAEIRVEPNVGTTMKLVSKSISQVNLISEKILEKSSSITNQMIPFTHPAKESVVKLPHVQVDFVLHPPIEIFENANVKPNVELVIETHVEPCVVSVSQVDLVSDKAVEPSSTPNVYAVFVGASVNEPTKLIFCSPTNSVVKPGFGTSHAQIESVVELSSENIVDLYEPFRILISSVIETVVESIIVTPHISLSLMSYRMLKHPKTNLLMLLKQVLRSPKLLLMWLKINLAVACEC